VKTAVNAMSASVSGGKALHEIAAGLLRGLDWARQHLQNLDTDEKVSAILDGLEEPSPEQLVRFEAMARFVPVAMNGLLRDGLKEGLAKLPGQKMGRKAVSLAQKNAICDAVGVLNRSGCTLRVAKWRVGQRYGVTARTVSRIWKKRGEYKTDFEPEEVQALLSNLLRGQGDAGLVGERHTAIVAADSEANPKQ